MGEEELAVVAHHHADIAPCVPRARGRRTRDGFQRRRIVASASLVDEVLAVLHGVAAGEGEDEEDEVLVREHDLGLSGQVLGRSMDAEVGERRRVGEAEGDPYGVAGGP